MSNKTMPAPSLLRVNLGSGSVTRQDIPHELIKTYIGGRGLGAYYLTSGVPRRIDPLGPENILIFMNGALTGTMFPGANKINCTFYSPLTHTYSYSLCGGHWGPELRFAGYLGCIVEGRAEKPVYLWIDDSAVEIRPAGHLWGTTIPESETLIRRELGGDEQLQIALIGPAGENLNRYATVTAGWYREFGRGGVGAVMGSKNLKGIAVRGTGDIAPVDPAGTMKLAESLHNALKIHPKAVDRRNFGTAELVKSINDNGVLCTRNFNDNYFEEGYKLEGTRMRDDIVIGDASCYACPVGCGKRSYIYSRELGEVLIEGPEFETIALLGSNCGVSDWEFLLKAAEICDYNGMDTMNTGSCAALAMECFEKGIIGPEQTGGLDLRFGNGDALVKLVQMIAKREGIGDILAEGIRHASEAFGAPELGMHSKGQGLSAYDPRGCKGMALTYATSPKGAHHMIATTMVAEISGGTRLSYEKKGLLQRDHQFSMCAVDSLGICSTMRGGFGLVDQARAFSLVTGLNLDDAALTKASERIINLERMYNVNMGFSRKDDTLPERILKTPVTAGPSTGEILDLDIMLDEYYDAMGWDRDGIPSPEKLSELGIRDIVRRDSRS